MKNGARLVLVLRDKVPKETKKKEEFNDANLFTRRARLFWSSLRFLDPERLVLVLSFSCACCDRKEWDIGRGTKLSIGRGGSNDIVIKVNILKRILYVWTRKSPHCVLQYSSWCCSIWFGLPTWIRILWYLASTRPSMVAGCRTYPPTGPGSMAGQSSWGDLAFNMNLKSIIC